MKESLSWNEVADLLSPLHRRVDDVSVDVSELSDKLQQLSRKFNAVLAVCCEVQRLLRQPLTDEQLALLALESRAGVLAVDVDADDLLGAPVDRRSSSEVVGDVLRGFAIE